MRPILFVVLLSVAGLVIGVRPSASASSTSTSSSSAANLLPATLTRLARYNKGEVPLLIIRPVDDKSTNGHQNSGGGGGGESDLFSFDKLLPKLGIDIISKLKNVVKFPSGLFGSGGGGGGGGNGGGQSPPKIIGAYNNYNDYGSSGSGGGGGGSGNSHLAPPKDVHFHTLKSSIYPIHSAGYGYGYDSSSAAAANYAASASFVPKITVAPIYSYNALGGNSFAKPADSSYYGSYGDSSLSHRPHYEYPDGTVSTSLYFPKIEHYSGNQNWGSSKYFVQKSIDDLSSAELNGEESQTKLHFYAPKQQQRSSYDGVPTHKHLTANHFKQLRSPSYDLSELHHKPITTYAETAYSEVKPVVEYIREKFIPKYDSKVSESRVTPFYTSSTIVRLPTTISRKSSDVPEKASDFQPSVEYTTPPVTTYRQKLRPIATKSVPATSTVAPTKRTLRRGSTRTLTTAQK